MLKVKFILLIRLYYFGSFIYYFDLCGLAKNNELIFFISVRREIWVFHIIKNVEIDLIFFFVNWLRVLEKQDTIKRNEFYS